MDPRTVLTVAWAVLSLAGLCSLGYWAFLVFWRPAQAWQAIGGSAPLPWWEKCSGWLACLTLFVVYLTGYRALLGWMPGGWGWVSQGDGDPYYTTVRSVLVFVLALASAIGTATAAEALAFARMDQARRRAPKA